MFGNRGQLLFVVVAVAGASVVTAKHLEKRAAQPAGAVQRTAVKTEKPAQVAAITFVPPSRTGYGEYRIPANSVGQYTADVLVNGSPFRMLVDTGATYVSLSYQDAARIGVFPSPADYKYTTHTANGTAKVALVTLTDVRIGTILVDRVEALVSEQGAMTTSLLGMSFLKRLSKMEVAADALVLRQ